MLSKEFRKNKTPKFILMEAMLRQVPKYGWSWKALYKGTSTVKEFKAWNESEMQALFENKIANIVKVFNERLDQDMIKLCDKNLNEELGITQKVRQLILFRLDASKDNKEIIKSSIYFMSNPKNSYNALEQLLTTCNKIWKVAGDESRGTTFFSKRFILAGVYSSTLGYWLSSSNRSNEETEEFLDKRLEDVKNLGKVKTNLFNIVGKKYNG